MDIKTSETKSGLPSMAQNETELDDIGPKINSLQLNEDDTEDEEDDLSDDEQLYSDDYDEYSEEYILPQLPSKTLNEKEAFKPYNLILNDGLRHFWEQYFSDKQYVRWTTFLNKLEMHLSSPRHENYENNDNNTKLPISPYGYGLHKNELNTLFREREGKRNYMKAIQYSLDLENTGVLSVYQVALIIKNILPANLPLKYLLFHLAHLGGKVILPNTLFPITNTNNFMKILKNAYERAVAAEKEYIIHENQFNKKGQNNHQSNVKQLSLSVAGLYSPYAHCNEDLQGPMQLQESIEAFMNQCRGITIPTTTPTTTPTSTSTSTTTSSKSSGVINILASPCGQGSTTRVTTALHHLLHTALLHHHKLIQTTAMNGSLSIWDLLNNSYNNTGFNTNNMTNTVSNIESLPTTKQTEEVTYSLAEVANDNFILSNLFDVIYINLRHCNSKSDILSAFSAQLALRGIENNIIMIQESVQRFLTSLRNGSLLILDHVHSSSTSTVKSLLSSILTASNKKNKVSVIVIPSMQCTTPILTPGLDTTTAAANDSTTTGSTKLPKYYGSSGRRRLALEKELETRSTVHFLTELHTIVTGLGIRWNLHNTNNSSSNTTSNEDMYEDIPSNVMLLTYSLSMDETKSLVYKMHKEVTTHQRLLMLQNKESNSTTITTSATSTESILENEVVEGICALSGGIPSIIRLLLLQNADTINYLLKRRNEQVTTSSLPSYMSTANTIRTTSGTNVGMIGQNSPKVKLNIDGTANTTSGTTGILDMNNPYTGLPSLYSIGWELLQAPALALSDTDRLLLYALSPLLYAHFHTPTTATDANTKTTTSTSNPNPSTTGTTTSIGPKPYTTRSYPLSFDTALAWYLAKPLFIHYITSTTSSKSGSQINIQTYTGKYNTTSKHQEEAYNQYTLSLQKLISTGWLQVSSTGLPPLSNHNKVLYFNNTIIPQYNNIRKTLKLVNDTISTVYTDTVLMNNYIQYITWKYLDISKKLLLINKLLLTPEVGYVSNILQQRNLLILSQIDNLLQPHFNYLINILIYKLTIKKEYHKKKKIINKSRLPIGDRDKGNSKENTSINAEILSEDEGFGTPGRYRDRAGSLGSDNSDTISMLRMNSGSSRLHRDSLGSDPYAEISYSLDDEDRQSEDGSIVSHTDRDSSGRVRTTSEISSDDGEGGSSGRESTVLASPGGSKGARDSKQLTEEEGMLSASEARAILAEWMGHYQTLALLRLPADLSTSLAVHASKILQNIPIDQHNTEESYQQAHSLMDLGILLAELYLQHSSETAISQGWSKGSLHYSSVESSVSRHLAATSSKLLQKALEMIQNTIKLHTTTSNSSSNTRNNKELLLKLLENELKIEYNLGKLSLYIAIEAERMSYVSCTTINNIDEVLVIKLQNKAKVARLHGIDLLDTILPNTIIRLETLLNEIHTTTTTTADDNTTNNTFLWNNYKKEINNVVVLTTEDNTSTSTDIHATSAAVHGISIPQSNRHDNNDYTSSILSEHLLLVLNKLTTKKVAIDANLLIAEHYTQHLLEHKLGHINANYIRSMIPATPNVPLLPYKSNENLKNMTQNTSTTTATATSTTPPLPLPSGVQQHKSSENLPIDVIPDAEVESPQDKVNAFSSAVQNTMNTTTSTASPSKPKNFIYPLLLHTGRLDLVQQLLDRDYLLQQGKLIEKLIQQQEDMREESRKSKVLPTPTTPPSPTGTTHTNSSTPVLKQSLDLIFHEELSPQEEEELQNINQPSSTPIPAFSNMNLIHSYRQAKKYYEYVIKQYIQLFGSDSILASEVCVYYANLLRSFGYDELAKPLYELSLKIFKLHNISTYQLPTATTAHCWLGLASYFDIHHTTILAPISDTKYTNNMLYSSSSSSTSSNNNMQYKHKNELSLRLYEEALNIYKTVYTTTHYTIILTSQTLLPILIQLENYQKGIHLLDDSIYNMRIHLYYTRNIQKYLYNQYRIKKHRLNTRSTLINEKTKLSDEKIIKNLEITIELNQYSIQTIIYHIGLLLIQFSRFYDYNKKYMRSIVFYKEAILCFRELRLSIMRRIKKYILLKKHEYTVMNTSIPNIVDNHIHQENEEENDLIVTNPIERNLALHIAQTMRDLSQSLFEEGVRKMGGRKVGGCALPDFQYRHALYVLNRAIEIYQSFDLTISAPLLKNAYIQKARMCTQQSDYEHAKHCFELVMHLFMEVKFDNYEDIAVVRTEYGRLMAQCGESHEAALLFQQSIDVYRRQRGETKWVCMEVAENLLERAAALIDLKVYEEAQPCLEDCLKMLPMVLGPVAAQRDTRMAACHNHLASVYHYYEETDKALEHYHAAQTVYQTAKMEYSLEMANVCNNLATLYDDLGQLNEAKAMYEQTVVILFRYHGAAHPQILVTLENLMNLLQDMGLKEEYQSVLDHLDEMEKQITSANKEDQERMEALNRALYGQAVAEQEERLLKQSRSTGAHPTTSTTGGGKLHNNETTTPTNTSDTAASIETRSTYPYTPQVVIVGGGNEYDEEDEEYDDNDDIVAVTTGDNSDVLLNIQAKEQAIHNEQQNSFFNFSLLSNHHHNSSTRLTAEEEWCRSNNTYKVGRSGGIIDDFQDEEDGFRWGGKLAAIDTPAATTSSTGKEHAELNMHYLGDYNNSSELLTMKRDMNSRYGGSTTTTNANANTSAHTKRGSIADTFRRGTSSTNGSGMRTLRPLGARTPTEASAQEDELPSGNCTLM